ncbi:LysM peptidoglycan-binding domain-containing protein, partial [Paenibacillus radicis (ex Gao et al. 2016)]|uniref:LysM peptidoglycan-binding domain-containing protein n=1 Tax=Paenibacillus radicis (ex Gao et al. 2016) TaxID=1737354 RepID=UPI001663C101
MKIYVVKQGDTLYFISQKHNVSIEEILKLNPTITNPDALDVGTKLKIPSSHGGGVGDIMHQHVVKQGDTLWKLSKAWGVPLADMIKANPQLKNPNVLLTGEIVNIPKAGHASVELPAAGTGSAHHPLHPMSIVQGVQNLVGGKKPTGPIQGKTNTAPIAPAQVAPVAPIKQPTGPVIDKKPTAPIVKPVEPANIPAPQPAAVKPNKPLPVEKPLKAEKAEKAGKKALPIQKELKPSVDLFKQSNIPAIEASSNTSPIFGNYGYGHGEHVSPVHTGYGYGNGIMPVANSNIGPSNIGPSNIGPSNIGPSNIGPSNIGPSNIGPSNIGPSNIGPSNIGPSNIGPSNIGPSNIGPSICPPGMMPVALGGYGNYGWGHQAVSPANVGPESTGGYGYGSWGPNAVS